MSDLSAAVTNDLTTRLLRRIEEGIGKTSSDHSLAYSEFYVIGDPPDLRTTGRQMGEALRDVLALHGTIRDFWKAQQMLYCGTCQVAYPCPTVRAIAVALGVWPGA